MISVVLYMIKSHTLNGKIVDKSTEIQLLFLLPEKYIFFYYETHLHFKIM